MQLMIVCDLFEWKRIDAGVFRLFLYVLPFEIQLSRGEGWDPLNWCSPSCPKPGFPASYIVVFIAYSEDHHCFSFLFIMCWYYAL